MSCVQARSGSGSGGLGAVVVVVLLGGLLILATLGGAATRVSAPAAAVSVHAVERHGSDAQVALTMVQNNGHCDNCVDGRIRCTASVGSDWAVAVYQLVKDSKGANGWVVVTSFLCDQNQAVRIRDECQPTWRNFHP